MTSPTGPQPPSPEQVAGSFISSLRGEAGGHATRIRRADQLLSDPDRQIGRLLSQCRSIMIVHAGGRLIYANPPVARFLGAQDPAELVGRHLAELVAPDDRPALDELNAAASAGRPAPASRRLRLARPDGADLVFDARSLPIIHEGSPALITTGIEIPADEKDSVPPGLMTTEVLHPEDFREILALEQRRSLRTGLPLSLFLLQPDDAGSRPPTDTGVGALMATALWCRRTLRAADHVGVPDEHTVALILPVTELEGAVQLGGRLRGLVARNVTSSRPLLFSSGVVAYSPVRDADADALLFRARAALVDARLSGGNQTIAKE